MAVRDRPVHLRSLGNRYDTRHLRNLLADGNLTGEAADRRDKVVARLNEVCDAPPRPWRWPNLQIRAREVHL